MEPHVQDFGVWAIGVLNKDGMNCVFSMLTFPWRTSCPSAQAIADAYLLMAEDEEGLERETFFTQLDTVFRNAHVIDESKMGPAGLFFLQAAINALAGHRYMKPVSFNGDLPETLFADVSFNKTRTEIDKWTRKVCGLSTIGIATGRLGPNVSIAQFFDALDTTLIPVLNTYPSCRHLAAYINKIKFIIIESIVDCWSHVLGSSFNGVKISYELNEFLDDEELEETAADQAVLPEEGEELEEEEAEELVQYRACRPRHA